MTNIEKSFLLEQELTELLRQFKTEIIPEFESALAKLPEAQRSMIVSLLVTANTQRFETAVSMADMDVFCDPIRCLGDALGLDEKKTKKYLQRYGRFYRLLDH